MRLPHAPALLPWSLLAWLAPFAPAQIHTNTSPPTTPAGAAIGANVGTSISIFGDWMAVGGPANFEPATPGAVWLYERAGGSWLERQMLQASAGRDTFGHAVALYGSWLAVSAPRDPAGPAIRLYQLQGGVWVLRETLTVVDSLPNETSFDDFGWALAMDGTTLIASEPNGDLGAQPNVGAIHIFERAAAVWSQVATLRPEPGLPFVHWGEEVELDGDTLAVGAPGTTITPGVVDVYRESAGAFAFEARLAPTNPTPGHPLREPADPAISIALDGDWIAIGDPDLGDFHGGVFLFERVGSQWLQRALLTPAIEAGRARGVGYDVDLEGNRLVAGCGFSSELVYWARGLAGWEERLRFRQQGVSGLTSVGRVARLDGQDVVAGYLYWPPTDTSDVGAWASFPGASFLAHSTDCHGDGLEAACPCTDSFLVHAAGCPNTQGQGAFLLAHGSGSFAGEDTWLTLYGARPLNSAIVAWSGGALRPATPFGAGLLCLGSPFQRLAVRQTDAAGSATWGPGPAGFGAISPGDLVHFQAWYRDPAPLCGDGFNLSNVQSVWFLF